jgi:DNA-binding response OmpR family regulator
MQSIGDILVVEDDEPTVVFIAEALRDEGYSVRASLNLADARALIAEHRPDLALLDLHLLNESGHTLVRELSTDRLAHIPVILMTADAQAAQELSMDGIDYCLLKPFGLDELIDCVTKHIRRNCIA